MACALVGTQNGVDCGVGGIFASLIIPKEDIVSTTTVAGVITVFTLASTKSFTRYDLDDENDISLWEVLQASPRGKHAARALFSTNGASALSVAVARGFDSCCGVVAVHYLNNGSAFVQGLVLESDVLSVASSGAAKGRTSILGVTAAEEARTEIEILSNDLRMPPTTDIDIATLEALVGV